MVHCDNDTLDRKKGELGGLPSLGV